MSLGGTTEVVWLGHATFQFTLPQGQVVLLDPWLKGNPRYPRDRPEPQRVDAILVTHGHGDHVGDLLRLAQRHRPKLVAIYDLAEYYGSKGVPQESLVGMNKGGTTEPIPGLIVTQVRAEHSSGIVDENGTRIYVGEPVGYVIEIRGMPTIYAAGDTDLFSDMALIRELHRPRAAILPIGGFFTMDPRRAGMAARMLGVESVIPAHYGTFPLLAGTPQQLREFVPPGVQVIATEPGEVLP